MCRQGLFYIFNQAPSLNLQKIIQRHIIGKNWRFFLKWALNIGFFTARHVHAVHAQAVHARAVQGYVMHGHSMQAMSCKPCHASHVIHGHVMHANAVH
jgi:hypothetical protein